MDAKNDDSGGSDSLDKSLQRKCVVDDVGQGEGTAASETVMESASTSGGSVEDQNATPSNFKTEQFVGDCGLGGSGNNITHNAQDGPQSSTETSQLSSDNTSNHNNAFESKVKQISKNLKETTLAENTVENDTTSSSLSSSSTSSEYETTPSCSSQGNSNCQSADLDRSPHSVNESLDDHDHRSKKVRFHPDVKENDGGNRVIPKKKKKIKNNQTGEDSNSGTPRAANTDEEMDLDEEEDIEEEEEEFDMVKTMSEAADYLKSHPLTFVRPNDKGAPPPKNGLLEDDIKDISDITPEAHFIEQSAPESGVQRILGKHVRCGKAEFMLCYADKSTLAWETEEFIMKHCPNLLHSYEQNREVRQERLMLHVAKRQNVRQRYTDF